MPKIDSKKFIEALGTSNESFMHVYIEQTDCNRFIFDSPVWSVKRLNAMCAALNVDPDDVLVDGHSISVHTKPYGTKHSGTRVVDRVIVANGLKVV